MKLIYTTRDGKMQVELEADTQVDLWRELAKFQEVFEDNVCTKNGVTSDEVIFRVREDDDGNEYFEKVCVSKDPKVRGARKRYGVHKKGGTLFPRTKDSDGKWLPDNGWVKWNPETKREE